MAKLDKNFKCSKELKMMFATMNLTRGERKAFMAAQCHADNTERAVIISNGTKKKGDRGSRLKEADSE